MSAPVKPQAATTRFGAAYERLCEQIAGVVLTSEQNVSLAVTCLLANSHLLVEDVPGVGKTTMAKAIAAAVGGSFGRVQGTPDLLPADVVGTAVFHQENHSFDFRPGPIFANVVLVDEINRASPRTQSSLLEAMAERQVTVDRDTHLLPDPFLVIATQNPMEHHGTFPLPESQLDRFLMRIHLGYPSHQDEARLLEGFEPANELGAAQPALPAGQVTAMQKFCTKIHVAPEISAYLIKLAEVSRRDPGFEPGLSTRALMGWRSAARVRAATLGREFVTPDDVRQLAQPIVAHRIPSGSSGPANAAAMVDDLIDAVPPPR